MRLSIVASCFAFVAMGFVLGLLFSAGFCDAAAIDSFAKVNLVQGMEATLAPGNQEYLAPEDSNIPSHFNLSGPANYNVEVQLTVLDPESQWSDQVSMPGLSIASHHDPHGNLNLDIPFDGLPLEGDSSNQPTRYIITLTYE